MHCLVLLGHIGGHKFDSRRSSFSKMSSGVPISLRSTSSMMWKEVFHQRKVSFMQLQCNKPWSCLDTDSIFFFKSQCHSMFTKWTKIMSDGFWVITGWPHKIPTQTKMLGCWESRRRHLLSIDCIKMFWCAISRGKIPKTVIFSSIKEFWRKSKSLRL
jgi:hypothetical protein